MSSKEFSHVGKSSITKYKQVDLKDLLKTQITKAAAILRNNSLPETTMWLNGYYHIFDITAGSADSNDTSPIIILKEMLAIKDLPYKAWFIEANPKTYQLLKLNIEKFLEKLPSYEKEYIQSNESISIHNMDCVKFLNGRFMAQNKDEFGYPRIGLLYLDHNGTANRILPCLENISRRWTKLDLLININAGAIKRCLGCTKNNLPGFEKFLPLKESIAKINKKTWYIRDHYYGCGTKYKWVMLFGTNYPNTNGRNYNICRPKDFVPLDSEEGQRIITECGGELDERGKNRPDKSKKPIQRPISDKPRYPKCHQIKYGKGGV